MDVSHVIAAFTLYIVAGVLSVIIYNYFARRKVHSKVQIIIYSIIVAVISVCLSNIIINIHNYIFKNDWGVAPLICILSFHFPAEPLPTIIFTYIFAIIISILAVLNDYRGWLYKLAKKIKFINKCDKDILYHTLFDNEEVTIQYPIGENRYCGIVNSYLENSDGVEVSMTRVSVYTNENIKVYTGDTMYLNMKWNEFIVVKNYMHRNKK